MLEVNLQIEKLDMLMNRVKQEIALLYVLDWKTCSKRIEKNIKDIKAVLLLIQKECQKTHNEIETDNEREKVARSNLKVLDVAAAARNIVFDIVMDEIKEKIDIDLDDLKISDE